MMIILLNQNIVHGQPSEKKDVFPILIHLTHGIHIQHGLTLDIYTPEGTLVDDGQKWPTSILLLHPRALALTRLSLALGREGGGGWGDNQKQVTQKTASQVNLCKCTNAAGRTKEADKGIFIKPRRQIYLVEWV